VQKNATSGKIFGREASSLPQDACERVLLSALRSVPATQHCADAAAPVELMCEREDSASDGVSSASSSDGASAAPRRPSLLPALRQ
jgi:hypothetical protein